MLVLSRKEGESIEFPSLGIVIRLVGLKKSRAAIGIEAPRDVEVVRQNEASLRNRAEPTGHRRRVGSTQDLLMSLEAEISTLADLAAYEDRDVAERIAAEALVKVRQLARSSTQPQTNHDNIRPLADFVAKRTKVLEYFGDRPEPIVEVPDQVHQSHSSYVVMSRHPTSAHVA